MQENSQVTGIGVDIVSVERIGIAVQRSDAFLRRNFSERELAYCMSGTSRNEHLAARFAGKEAASKALGSRFRPTEVEVVRDEKGIPGVCLSGRTLEENPQTQLLLSVSHDGEYAVAFCVAFR